MSRVIVNAAVSLDGFIARPDDDPGPIFDFYENGPVAIAPGDPERTFHVSEATAGFMRDAWPQQGAMVIGRHLFDITDGWKGRPSVGDHVFVVTHEPPTDWNHPDAPFTFVDDLARPYRGRRNSPAIGTSPSPLATSADRRSNSGSSTNCGSTSPRWFSEGASATSVTTTGRNCCCRTRRSHRATA